MEKEILVSICMITYGHEQFITEAILGVAMQQCNFEWELIIADDHSPDQTEEQVEIALRNLNIKNVNYTKHSKNKGMMDNFIWALDQCKGKYIALCEGDDYWSNPLKLQKQIDFLEAHPDYVMSFHQGSNYYQESMKMENFINDPELLKGKLGPKEVIRLGGNLCPTNAMVFRNNVIEYPNFFLQAKSGDRALCLLLLEKGKFHFLNKNMCVYRVHEGGVSRGLSKQKIIAFKESNIEVLNAFNSYSNYKYQYQIKREISSQIRNIFICDPHYLFKTKYLNRINIKHFALSLTRIFINTCSLPLSKTNSF